MGNLLTFFEPGAPSEPVHLSLLQAVMLTQGFQALYPSTRNYFFFHCASNLVITPECLPHIVLKHAIVYV